MEIFDNTLMTLALGGLAVSGLLFASALLYPYLRRAWDKATALARAVFCGAVVVACLFGGAKHKTGGITYPKTDTDVAYLTDAGSYVTNDAVHVAFTRVIVPDTATFYLDYCAIDATNAQGVATNWVNAKTATFADLTVPFDFAFAAATNYNWLAYTDWTPGPAVQTNGVWHAYWGIDKKQGRYFIPVRTCVRDGGEVIATPKSKWDAKDPMELTEAEAYERYAPDTAFVVSVTNGHTYAVNVSWLSSTASEDRVIDWGDGEKTVGKDGGVSHTYAKDGAFVVRVKDGASMVNPACGDARGSPAASADVLTMHLRWGDSLISQGRAFQYAKNVKQSWVPRWGANMVDVSYCYCRCSIGGTVPKWTAKITNAYCTYSNCTGLTGDIPEWGEQITNAGYTYYNCTGLTGDIPEWGEKITNAGNTYSHCTGLTGDVPEWGEQITNAGNTYYNCTGLTGDVPEWGEKITNAGYTYYNCTGLTGKIPSRWPDSMVSAQRTFLGARNVTGTIPAWGKNMKGSVEWMYERCSKLTGDVPEWTDNLTDVRGAFYGCSGLTGTIKKWGANTTIAYSCYEGCSGLTGAWTSDPAELMPTNITSHGNTVLNASDALRALFYSDWGGTRTKTE